MPQRQKDLRLLEKRPKEGHRDSEEAGGEAIQRVAEGIWFSCREDTELTPHLGPLSSSQGQHRDSFALCSLRPGTGAKGMPGAVSGDD